MKARAVFLASLAAMFSASTVHAEDCELRPSNLDAFGKHRLGHLRSIPSDLKQLSRCVDGAKFHDCEYVDADGTQYTTADDKIVKIVRRPNTSTGLPPSYPLKFGMSFEEARKALSAMDPKIEFSPAGSPTKGYSIDTGECMTNSKGMLFYFSARFSKAGRLNRLEAAVETDED
jgi:hypothetical protein